MILDQAIATVERMIARKETLGRVERFGQTSRDIAALHLHEADALSLLVAAVKSRTPVDSATLPPKGAASG